MGLTGIAMALDRETRKDSHLSLTSSFAWDELLVGTAEKSEHEHYGPYSYLEIMTWPEPGFDRHAVRGSLSDLERLAAIVAAKLASAQPGEAISIRTEFAVNSSYALILQVREDDFDPAEADPMLPEANG